MQLKEFSLFQPVIEIGTVLKALEIGIPSAAIEQAIDEAKAREERTRALPTHLVIGVIIAMSLWSKVSMRGVRQISRRWVKRSVGESRVILASTV